MMEAVGSYWDGRCVSSVCRRICTPSCPPSSPWALWRFWTCTPSPSVGSSLPMLHPHGKPRLREHDMLDPAQELPGDAPFSCHLVAESAARVAGSGRLGGGSTCRGCIPTSLSSKLVCVRSAGSQAGGPGSGSSSPWTPRFVLVRWLKGDRLPAPLMLNLHPALPLCSLRASSRTTCTSLLLSILLTTPQGMQWCESLQCRGLDGSSAGKVCVV